MTEYEMEMKVCKIVSLIQNVVSLNKDDSEEGFAEGVKFTKTLFSRLWEGVNDADVHAEFFRRAGKIALQ